MEIDEVIEALQSGWITTGPKTKELERRLASYLGTDRVVCLNSQTACAEQTLRLLGIGEGDEVITTAYTYTASASVIEHVGAKIVLVDTQEDSLEMDYAKAEALVNEKTKVIIPVDIAGVPCDYDRIYELVDRKKDLFHASNEIQEAFNRLIILADTAHSFGAKVGDMPAGNQADFSAFSFHAVKNFTTAEGGALTWRQIPGVDDEEIYNRLQLLSLHGQSKDALSKSAIGAWEYDIKTLGYKCNMTDMAAGLGLAQLKRYPGLLARRREIIERYDEAFRPLGVETLDHYTDKHQSSGHLYITRLPGIGEEERNEIIIKMGEAGIACNVHYKPLPMFTAYQALGYDIQDFPNAYKHYENEITLPLHTKLTDEEVEYIIQEYTLLVKKYCCDNSEKY